MRPVHRSLATWLLGLAGLIAIVYFFTPEQFGRSLRAVGAAGTIAWLALTLSARLMQVEITVLPLKVLGYSLERADAFWIGWIRTFSNQVLPLSGLAFFAHQMRRRAGISWSEVASLSTPQFLLAAAALGLIGFAATAGAGDYMGSAALPTMLVFAAVSAFAILIASKAAWLIGRLPAGIARRATNAANSFRTLAGHPWLLPRLVLLHVATILLRGSRILILFFALGADLTWQQSVLMLAIAESAALFQLTPGGLGLREGAIVGASLLLHISPDAGATVALIDRLFAVGITALLAAPAVPILRRSDTATPH